MEYQRLIKLRERLYFTIADLAELFGLKAQSAMVLCSRYVKSGRFIRLKNNFYILDEKWANFTRDDFLKIANFLQVPSYISFMTALWFYGVTTQVPRNFFESACLKRSKRFNIKETVFNYYKLKKELYSGFIKKEDIFIAVKEKAFLDSVYLFSFGKYKLDISSLDLAKLDKGVLAKTARLFPRKTRFILEKLCKI